MTLSCNYCCQCWYITQTLLIDVNSDSPSIYQAETVKCTLTHYFMLLEFRLYSTCIFFSNVVCVFMDNFFGSPTLKLTEVAKLLHNFNISNLLFSNTNDNRCFRLLSFNYEILF